MLYTYVDEEQHLLSWGKRALLSWQNILTTTQRNCGFLRNQSFSKYKSFHVVHIFFITTESIYSTGVDPCCKNSDSHSSNNLEALSVQLFL